jgi:hypothetical protein
MNIRNIIVLLLASTLIVTLCACSEGMAISTNDISASQPASEDEGISGIISVEYDGDDLDIGSVSDDMSFIILEGNSITLNGDGAVVDENQIAITSAGTYHISGTLDEGQIIVNTKDQETVKLIFNGVNINCSWSSPVYIKNAEKTVITLADGTDNFITDGDSYIVEESTIENSESIEPNAAIFSKDDLTINGNGSLTVNANYYNGIQSKDDLKITGGIIIVNAVNDGIKGRDSVAIMDGNIKINAGADGIQSNNDTDSEKGFVNIEGGHMDITAGKDGIQAETSILVSGGSITILSGGGSADSPGKDNRDDWGPGDMWNAMENTPESDASAVSTKGLKAAIDIIISGGVTNIDSLDDSIHSNESITINGGDITLSSGDDGMHSDTTLVINGGDIRIISCYEGIDSPTITINDGNIHLVASDDGVNSASGNGDFPVMGRPGQNEFEVSGDYYLNINGGYIVIDTEGDGFDINGSIKITGGIVIINGPESNNNGALDYIGTFQITGGFLVAVGSSGMAQAPDSSSNQYSVLLNLSSSQPADTLIHFETEDGEDILTFMPAKSYQSVVLSSSDLQNGPTYVVYSGGSSTGTAVDGLYSSGTYTPGSQITSFTISNITTSIGSSGDRFPSGRRR